MAAKPSQPLSQSDLSRYVRDNSDFALEMAVLSSLRKMGIVAEHAGSYVDPVTGKLRAYDIRAHWIDGIRTLRLAIECKSLEAIAPLLIYATPRLASEAYHSVMFRYRIGGSMFIDVDSRAGVYVVDEPVGRQPDQPMLDSNGNFKSNDTATFDKWIQAVNGCSDLVKASLHTPFSPGGGDAAAVIPMLVVPEQMLWQVSYHADGTIDQDAHMVDNATLILRHTWTHPGNFGPVNYSVSHLEIVTLGSMPARLRSLMSDAGMFNGSESALTSKQ
jgi:hypothetical protein